ncbi:hypothetical protein OUZ56_031808 [Daphnia magna]|uniref:Uncharacterized protein n=1 Tax=Daphnia magna TaxID=35525 RepID=A0ABQ9ZVQ7_9CRUS|nr:hypothetical protein OUZ56_031808 [Daphnia magna]
MKRNTRTSAHCRFPSTRSSFSSNRKANHAMPPCPSLHYQRCRHRFDDPSTGYAFHVCVIENSTSRLVFYGGTPPAPL